MKQIYFLFLSIFYVAALSAATPTVGAPNPLPDLSGQPDKVLSLYGYYGQGAGTTRFNSMGNLSSSTVSAGGNECLKIQKSDINAWAASIIQGASEFLPDLTEYKELHLQLWDDENGGNVDIALIYYSEEDTWDQKILDKPVPVANTWGTYKFTIPTDIDLTKVRGVQIVPTWSKNNPYYIDNIYFTKDIPAVSSEPADWLTPPERTNGNYFSFFNDAPYSVSIGGEGGFANVWNSSSSPYQIAENQYAQKINFTNQGGQAYKLNTPQNVSGFTHIHFDIWAVDAMPTSDLFIALYKDGGADGNRSQKRTGGFAEKSWTEVDIRLSDFATSAGTLNDNLSNLKTIRFETSSTTSGTKTFYVDNIYFYTPDVDENAPSAPAYLPPVIRESNYLLSVFSDSYTNSIVPAFPIQPDTVTISNDKVLRFKNVDNISISFPGPGVDISTMSHLHLDVWTKETANMELKLNNTVVPFSADTTLGGWLRLEVELPENLTPVTSLNISGNNTVYCIDNMYFYKHQEPFTVDIKEYNDSLYRGINYGDIFDFDNAIAKWKPEYVEMVKALGFSHVRLPVRWEDYGRSMNESPYNITPSFIKTIQEIVDLAIAHDLKIIVNMHHHTKVQADPAGQEERFVTQWKQIAEYFRYYPDNLSFEIFNEPNADNSGTSNITFDVWNDLFVAGLDAIRESNPTRPVMIGVAGGGGIPGLQYLELPPADSNLIVTIHYYSPHNFTHQGAEFSNPIPPIGLEWLDTETDRINVHNDFQRIADFLNKPENNGIPVHIGEFGVYEKADMDSRVRWTTYVARYIEQQGYSSAYWDFDAKFGIYDPVNQVYREPLVKALLNNPMPAKPMEIGSVSIQTYYNSETDGTNVFTGWGADISKTNNKLVFNITNGGSAITKVQAYRKQAVEKDLTYKVTFTVSSDVDLGIEYQTYIQKKTYEKYSQIFKFTPTTAPTEYSYMFTMEYDSDPVAEMFFDVGGSESNPLKLTFEKIKVEQIAARLVAAPSPIPEANKVNNIYSSVYADNKEFSYSSAELVSSISDTNNGSVILFSDFDSQTITLSGNLSVDNKRILHLEAFAGSPLDLEITISGSMNKKVTYPLPSHEWTSLNINLADVLTDGAYINTITLSGGTGSGRKLYIDHLYLFDCPNTWTGLADASWSNPDNWSLKIVPDNASIVYMSGTASNYPVLSGSENNVCKEIYFTPGAQLGRADLLTYEKAHVQMDFGLGGSEQLESTDVNDHLAYSTHHSAASITRNKWHMLSMPLSKVLTGDLSFGGYPATYIRKFDASKSVSGSVLKANWSEYYSTPVEEFQPGEGFIFWMSSYQNLWPFMEYNVENEKEYGLKLVNGIIELPYHEKNDMSNSHRVHEYNAETDTSTFYLFHSEGHLTGKTKKIKRGDETYRFIFEKDNPDSPNVLYPVTKPLEGSLALVGNPYMSVIDFDLFYEDNKDLIKPLYQLWTGNTFATYDVLTQQVTGDVSNTVNQFIPPMQSFLVELRDDFPAGGADLVFNIENITPANLTSNTLLKARSLNQGENLLTITSSNNGGTIKTFKAKRAEGSKLHSGYEGHKLISTIRAIPDIYFLKPIQGTTSMVGTPYAIIGNEDTEIPVALAANLTGKTTFTLEGMDQFDADITFIDLEKGVYENITDLDTYAYEFDFTPPLNGSTVLAKEDRFLINFSSGVSVGTNQGEDTENIWIYKHNNYINILTDNDDLILGATLYDIQGRTLFNKSSVNNVFYQIPVQEQSHLLMIIEVKTKKGVKRFKINAL